MRVAVVGGGPAGIYAADELIRQSEGSIDVDVIDRLPCPFGLVRYGVAPDHSSIKAIADALEKVLRHPKVRFFGHVEVGRDISPEALSSHYDAVVYATGTPVGSSLGIPGDHLLGVISAGDFVAWYSGHPDADLLTGGLKSSAVAVVGAGNVALDVVRILAKSETELRPTDMPLSVLTGLAESEIETIHLVCRRGPEHVKFTTKELRELLRLEDVEIDVGAELVERARHCVTDRVTLSNLDVLQELATRRVESPRRRIVMHFWSRPKHIDGDERVRAIRLERPPEPPAVAGATIDLSVGLVVTAVGYQGRAIPGLPFDELRGTVPNEQGRVLDVDGVVVPETYVAGWAKRGPSGVVGTNRACAAETVRSMFADWNEGLSARPDRRLSSEAPFVTRFSDYEGWLRIDAEERDRGVRHGKTRMKVADWASLRRLSRV